jgi:hypothetical protein
MDKQLNDLKPRVDSLEKQMEELSVSNKEMAQSLPGAGGPVVEEETTTEQETTTEEEKL